MKHPFFHPRSGIDRSTVSWISDCQLRKGKVQTSIVVIFPNLNKNSDDARTEKHMCNLMELYDNNFLLLSDIVGLWVQKVLIGSAHDQSPVDGWRAECLNWVSRPPFALEKVCIP